MREVGLKLISDTYSNKYLNYMRPYTESNSIVQNVRSSVRPDDDFRSRNM
jgi:hypothetical protein